MPSCIVQSGDRLGPFAFSSVVILTALAKQCLDAQGQGCEAWEREIDGIVAGLYGL